jgi:hypothetical protein
MERKNKGSQKDTSGGETMKTRRRWKAEEKLAIIKEVKEGNSHAEISRKYSIDPSRPSLPGCLVLPFHSLCLSAR